MTKARASLITSVIIGLLAITTAGVSTYAWFQANSSATVTAESTSTTITAAKPDDFTFWAYKGNGNDSYTPASPENFNTDFEQISSGSSKTSLTGMGPGQKMLFAVGFDDVTSLSLDVKSIISNNSSKQNITKRKVAGSSPDKLINIGWAMNIYSAESLNGTGYTSFMSSPGTDKFQVSADSDTSSWNVSSGSYANPTITYASNAYKNIFTKANTTQRATYYVFYMIEYSDNSGTWYKEVSSDSAGASELEFPTPGASARWFVKNASGNSNCYAGLDFAITEIVVTKNGEVVEQE